MYWGVSSKTWGWAQDNYNNGVQALNAPTPIPWEQSEIGCLFVIMINGIS